MNFRRSTSKISTEGFDFTAAEEKNRLLILQQKQQQQFEKVQQQQKEQEKNEFPFQEPKKSVSFRVFLLIFSKTFRSLFATG